MTYQLVKKYGPEFGLSCIFRTHTEHSGTKVHYLQGHTLSFGFLLEGYDHNSVYLSHGDFNLFERWLERIFAGTLLVAGDDERIDDIALLEQLDVAIVVVLEGGVGCEAFAKLAAERMKDHIRHIGRADFVRVAAVECTTQSGGARYMP